MAWVARQDAKEQDFGLGPPEGFQVDAVAPERGVFASAFPELDTMLR